MAPPAPRRPAKNPRKMNDSGSSFASRDDNRETAFFNLFDSYINLERTSGARYQSRDYSLERMAPLARCAGNPETQTRIVHVAGTKGKGSTCLYLAALLQSAGIRSGTFTSPHLRTVRERFRIDDRLVDYETLLRAARNLESSLRQNDLRPSLFEIMTVLSLRMFADEGVDFSILETGIGGLLDATNYVMPACTVITPVSLDHTGLLGTRVEEVAEQKAGIIKAGIPVVLAPQPFPAAEHVIRSVAREKGCAVEPVGAPSDPRWPLKGLPPFQVVNFSTALTACTMLGLQPEADNLALPHPPGRWERISKRPLVILDVAHNADSAHELVRALEQAYPGTGFTVVLGVLKGKDTTGIFRELCAVASHFVLTNPRSPRESDLDVLVRLAEEAEVPFDVVPELASREQLGDKQRLLFTGSFFTAVIGDELYRRQA